MKDIVLTIKSTQEINGEQDSSEFVSCGTYDYKTNEIELLYDESVALGVENIKTRLTADKNGVVELSRNNGDFGCLIIEKGKRHLCQYHTAYGNLMIGIYGEDIKNELNENGGSISLCYSIDINSGLLSRNKVEITIREDKIKCQQ